jgi:mannose-6-phosphate isomerase-like protein (cupin superfamily)
MTLEVRRVVTGHDKDGKAIIEIDEIAKNVITRRPGADSTVVWATNTFPPDMDTDEDISAGVTSTTIPDGVVCRISRFGPGVAPRVHRTASVDYAIVLSGEIHMEMDDEVVHLKAGDVLVQRGTIHNWVNNGTEPCMIAFILIDSKMPIRDGERLDPHG